MVTALLATGAEGGGRRRGRRRLPAVVKMTDCSYTFQLLPLTYYREDIFCIQHTITRCADAHLP